MNNTGAWVLYNTHIFRHTTALTLEEWVVIGLGVPLKCLYFAFKGVAIALWKGGLG